MQVTRIKGWQALLGGLIMLGGCQLELDRSLVEDDEDGGFACPKGYLCRPSQADAGFVDVVRAPDRDAGTLPDPERFPGVGSYFDSGSCAWDAGRDPFDGPFPWDGGYFSDASWPDPDTDASWDGDVIRPVPYSGDASWPDPDTDASWDGDVIRPVPYSGDASWPTHGDASWGTFADAGSPDPYADAGFWLDGDGGWWLSPDGGAEPGDICSELVPSAEGTLFLRDGRVVNLPENFVRFVRLSCGWSTSLDGSVDAAIR